MVNNVALTHQNDALYRYYKLPRVFRVIQAPSTVNKVNEKLSATSCNSYIYRELLDNTLLQFIVVYVVDYQWTSCAGHVLPTLKKLLLF